MISTIVWLLGLVCAIRCVFDSGFGRDEKPMKKETFAGLFFVFPKRLAPVLNCSSGPLRDAPAA